MSTIKPSGIIVQPAKDWYRWLYNSLYPISIDKEEAETVTHFLLSHYFDYQRKDYITNRLIKVTLQAYYQLEKALENLALDIPLQHIIGHVDFAGCRLRVNSDVLIPRIETEEMVTSLIAQGQGNIKTLLDIGTGSGCIAIALTHHWPTLTTTAVDISKKALTLARQNAIQNNVPQIYFQEMDILNPQFLKGQWDIIISNPPYIPIREVATINRRIVAYEPHEALFVPDEDPLIFYRHIAKIAHKNLSPDGQLYTETHPDWAQKVAHIYIAEGLEKTTIIKDLHSRNRWVQARR